MKKERLKVGDVVVLKSGGPRMVVTKSLMLIDEDSVICAWTDEAGKPQQHDFPVFCLIKKSSKDGRKGR